MFQINLVYRQLRQNLKEKKLLEEFSINVPHCMELANKAALKAGAALSKNKISWNVLVQEPDRDRKLRADSEAEKILVSLILENSDYPLITEETGWHGSTPTLYEKKEPEVFWVIDPLDGTVNYSMSIPICCVSIALVCSGKPILGVVYDFERNELFSGGLNLSAMLNGHSIKVSSTPNKSESVLMTGLPKARDFSDAGMYQFGKEVAGWQKVRMIGSAALSMAYVAAGRADAYQEEKIMPWDIAAGWALVNAGGGKVDVEMDDFRRPLNVFAHNGLLK